MKHEYDDMQRLTALLQALYQSDPEIILKVMAEQKPGKKQITEITDGIAPKDTSFMDIIGKLVNQRPDGVTEHPFYRAVGNFERIVEEDAYKTYASTPPSNAPKSILNIFLKGLYMGNIIGRLQDKLLSGKLDEELRRLYTIMSSKVVEDMIFRARIMINESDPMISELGERLKDSAELAKSYIAGGVVPAEQVFAVMNMVVSEVSEHRPDTSFGEMLSEIDRKLEEIGKEEER